MSQRWSKPTKAQHWASCPACATKIIARRHMVVQRYDAPPRPDGRLTWVHVWCRWKPLPAVGERGHTDASAPSARV